jgi:alkanesulfonate monooxygenase SsuD/methylene tetrahydromethanopterin reductase-like flavin-dependent oxidoreductase (luciferase family)
MQNTEPDSPERPSRLGLSLATSNAFSLTDLVEAVTFADTLGYDSAWIPETWSYDLSSVLSVLSMQTSRIFLAAGVFNVYSRSPALLAQTAATLQTISGGRFLLGLGASGPGVIERWHGLPYRNPLARTEDYVKIIRLALSGDRVNFDSDGFHLSGFKLGLRSPAPVPIYLAALGPQNIRLTGRIANGWLPIFAVRGQTAELFELLRQGAREAGRDPEHIDTAAYVPCLISPRGERLLAQQLAYYLGGMGSFYARYLSRLGFGAAVTEIRRLWEAGDRPAAVKAVPDGLLEAATLGTDAVTARGRIQEYREEGIRLPIITIPNGGTPEEARVTIGALAPAR